MQPIILCAIKNVKTSLFSKHKVGKDGKFKRQH